MLILFFKSIYISCVYKVTSLIKYFLFVQDGAWWMKSEKPWQTLGTCFEIRNALRYNGGPEAYPSCFPIHQDGSCNGLQHYAALGRAASGAESVNLAPSDIPQDVYSCVAAILSVN